MTRKAWMAAALLLAAARPVAAQQACLLEGTFLIMGQVIPTKDCMENRGLSEAQFHSSCDSLLSAGAMAGAPDGKLTYLRACPPSPQGICRSLSGSPLDAYYYKRSAEDLAGLPDSCRALHGTWEAAK